MNTILYIILIVSKFLIQIIIIMIMFLSRYKRACKLWTSRSRIWTRILEKWINSIFTFLHWAWPFNVLSEWIYSVQFELCLALTMIIPTSRSETWSNLNGFQTMNNIQSKKLCQYFVQHLFPLNVLKLLTKIEL